MSSQPLTLIFLRGLEPTPEGYSGYLCSKPLGSCSGKVYTCLALENIVQSEHEPMTQRR